MSRIDKKRRIKSDREREKRAEHLIVFVEFAVPTLFQETRSEFVFILERHSSKIQEKSKKEIFPLLTSRSSLLLLLLYVRPLIPNAFKSDDKNSSCSEIYLAPAK